jgi:hypothetical protein
MQGIPSFDQPKVLTITDHRSEKRIRPSGQVTAVFDLFCYRHYRHDKNLLVIDADGSFFPSGEIEASR